MLKYASFALLALLTCGMGRLWASDFYVSPTGSSSGNGSMASPWSLAAALSSPAAVKPGDTIWLRGGTYVMQTPSQFWSTLSGTAAAPIVVRRYAGELPVIDLKNLDSAFYVLGSNTWFWGLEFMSSTAARHSSSTGPWAALNAWIDVRGPGTKFINCYVHDLSTGLSFWHESVGAEAYGNIVYHVGWQAPDRGHGHALYSQNEAVSGVGRKIIAENFFGEAFDIGLQLYGTGAAVVQDYLLQGNVVWDNGIPTGQNVDQIVIAGGGASKKNIELDSNFVYNSGTTGYSRVGWQWDGVNGSVSLHGNWFVGGWHPLEIWHWSPVSFQNNFVCGDSGTQQIFAGLWQNTGQTPASYAWDNNRYCAGSMRYSQTTLDSAGNAVYLGGSDGSAASFKATTGWDKNSTFGTRPVAGAEVIVRPNKYEQGRANIIIFNWGKNPAVQVNLSAAGLSNGDSFVIKDVQNFNGAAVASGVYSSSNPVVSLPMANLPKTQITAWGSAVPHTAPAFGTFVLLGGAAMNGSGGGPVFTPDQQAPAVGIAAPSNGQTVSGSVTFRATATDNTAVSSVQLKVDGALLATLTSAPYQTSWNTTALANGSHVLTATATDSAGNSASASLSVTVSNTVTPPPPPPTSSAVLRGYWTMDNADLVSGMMLDKAGNGLNASALNTTSTAGRTLDARAFNGSSSTLTVLNTASVQLNASLSLAAWVKTTSARSESIISNYETSGNETGYLLKTTPAGELTLRIGGRNMTTGAREFTDARKINDGQWHHVAAVLVFGQSVTLYVDGQAGAIQTAASAAASSGAPLQIGNIAYPYYAKPFTGAIDEARIYSGALTAADVAQLAGGTASPTPGDTQAPTVSISSPGANATVTGNLTFTATASDNTAVTSVVLKVDGTAVATLTAAPYQTSLNTTTLANGAHLLTATASDAAGNSDSASVSVTVSNSTTPPPTGMPTPTGYWSMNSADLVSGMMLDKSGNGLNAVSTNTAAAAGRVQEARSFNGSNSALSVPAGNRLDLNNSLTISAWVKTQASRAEALVSTYDTAGTESGYLFKTTPAGTLSLRVSGRNMASGGKEFNDTKKINDGQWHHVAVVVTLGQMVSFYVDGVPTSTQSAVTRAGSSYMPFLIGSIAYPYYASQFSGALDEVKVYTTTLTASQVLQLASGN